MRKLLAESYRSPLWAAAYMINGGCSDDGFDDFHGWLIVQGREVFEDVVADPDALAERPGNCRLAFAFPVSRQLRCRVEMPVRLASSSWDSRRRCRHARNVSPTASRRMVAMPPDASSVNRAGSMT